MKKVLSLSIVLLLLITGVYAKTLTVYFNNDIDDATVPFLQKQLDDAVKGDHVKLIITSPGGLMIQGLAAYDYLVAVKQRGVTLDTYGSGICASAAMLLLQVGDTRYAYPTCELLVHNAYIRVPEYFEGRTPFDMLRIWMMRHYITQYDKDLQWTNEQQYVFYSNRIGKPIEQIRKDFSYDHWMTAQDAIDLGYLDKICKGDK
jgi:ATP-dependent protease ClpP protease subunit